MAIDGCNVGASWGIITNDRVVGKEQTSSWYECSAMVLNEEVVSSSAADVAAPSRPSELACWGWDEVGESFEFAVGARSVPQVVAASQIGCTGMGSEYNILGALRQGRLSV